MNKDELRKIYKEKRNGIPSEALEAMSMAIANNVLRLNIWKFSNYHLFLPIERLKEINTEYILQILFGKDKNVVLSRSNLENNSMKHYLLTDNTVIKKNKWGIPEPENGLEIQPGEIDVVFVPLLVADQRGHRVGYGKGYYDVFLHSCKAGIKKIGLSLFPPIDEYIANEANDIGLDYLVTPDHIYPFNQY